MLYRAVFSFIIGGIYFELQSPGVGFALAVSILGALLYFAPLYLEGLAANWEVLVFIAGIGLLLVEMFAIPGFGVAGISGIILMIAGLALSLIDNVIFDFTGIPFIEIFKAYGIEITRPYRSNFISENMKNFRNVNNIYKKILTITVNNEIEGYFFKNLNLAITHYKTRVT